MPASLPLQLFISSAVPIVVSRYSDHCTFVDVSFNELPFAMKMVLPEVIYDDDYDAAAVLLHRGERLRLLRQMERHDEEERALGKATEAGTPIQKRGDEENDPSTLDYESFLANQSYYDDYKHVNYRYIDFGCVEGRRLIIQQSRECGKGGLVWDAGFILADHLIRTQDVWNPCRRDRRVVELGSGTGVTGLLLAAALPKSHVHLTDLSQLLPLLEENSMGIPNATVGELEWGTTEPLEKFDLIVGSDVIAGIYDSVGLAKTIHDLATEHSEVYLACRDRLAGSLEQFETHLRRYFTKVERRHAQSRNKNPTVWIMFASGRCNPEALGVTMSNQSSASRAVDPCAVPVIAPTTSHGLILDASQ